tara:strand:+ start:2194 stop:3405 length:1212 start_codon:yes stop_codon:yes gene_type:complete
MSELEQTIEELEAEVLAELEEESAASAPKKNAAAAEKQGKLKGKTPGGEVEDGGAPVVDPEAKSSPTDVAAKGADEVSGDAQQKNEKPAEKMKKVKKVAEASDDDEEEEDEDGEEMSKKEMLAAMAKMPETKLEKMYAAYMATEEVELDEDDEMKEAVDAYVQNIDVAEDVNALLEGEALSEEFKEKAAAIFEAAVKSKTRTEIERIIEETQAEKNAEVDSIKDKISEDVDTYLDYVVEEWTKENELAIERGLKGEIAEDFISGLKQLFEDHYIDVPDERYDVLEAQSEKISELEEKLNEVIEKNINMKEANSSLVREQVISEVSEDLADTEIEKFKSLVEDVDFGSEEMFREKVATLKENYFPKTHGGFDLNDEDGSSAQDIDTTDTMHKYLSAISRSKAGA